MMSGTATRIPTNEDFDNGDWHLGKVNFQWHDLNEYEKLAAPTFEKGIEGRLEHLHPWFSLDPNEDETDVILRLTIAALGDGDNGPSWQYSLREAAESVLDYSQEDGAAQVKALRAIADYMEQLNGKSGDVRERMALAAELRPQQRPPTWAEELARTAAAEILTKIIR
jgi:hypothetical protein